MRDTGDFMSDEEQQASEVDKGLEKGCLGCLGLIGLFGVLILVLLVIGHFSGGDQEGDSGAYVKVSCREWVKEKLKAPASADFSSETTSYSSGRYTVTGLVDAQNSFGAQVRSSFTCVATHSGETTRLISVTVK